MSELSDRLRAEERRSELRCREIIAQGERDAVANVADVVWPRESFVWFWTKKIAWYIVIVLLGYACIWGIFAL